jgi:hypothetical protein
MFKEKFYCLVHKPDGTGARQSHKTYESAEQEAIRLHALGKGEFDVSILKTVAVWPATAIVVPEKKSEPHKAAAPLESLRPATKIIIKKRRIVPSPVSEEA